MFLLGGGEYTEPMVAQGAFVINSLGEIVNGYRNFYAGKYGKLKSTKKN